MYTCFQANPSPKSFRHGLQEGDPLLQHIGGSWFVLFLWTRAGCVFKCGQYGSFQTNVCLEENDPPVNLHRCVKPSCQYLYRLSSKETVGLHMFLYVYLGATYWTQWSWTMPVRLEGFAQRNLGRSSGIPGGHQQGKITKVFPQTFLRTSPTWCFP